jgi:anaerobic ribonucleoside-triphosphate reductase activating protein
VHIRVYNRSKETEVLGPGKRYAIWFQGCKKRCDGCIAPDSRELLGGELVEIEDILLEIQSIKTISGITISGGEPFEQKHELLILVKEIKKLEVDLDIILYTGNLVEDLIEDDICKKILLLTDLVIDGEYIESLDHGEPLKGSSNQSYYYFSPEGEELIDKIGLLEEREIEVEIIDEALFFIGVPNKIQKKIFKERRI